MELSVIKYGLSIAGLAATAGIIGLSQSFSGVSSALSISSLSQTSGSVNGGNTITIKGEGFTKQKKIKQFAHNRINVVALSEDNRIYIWGDAAAIYTPNNEGITYPDGCTPAKLEACAYYLNPVDITDQFGGDVVNKLYATSVNSFFATTNNGHIWAWGQNYSGQLATGDTTWSRKPINISDKFDGRITNLYTGSVIVAITDKNTIYTWGGDYYGADGRPGDNKTPMPVSNILEPNEQISNVSSTNSLAITTSAGRILVSGHNNKNRFGSLVPGYGSQNKLTDISAYFNGDKIVNTISTSTNTFFIDINGSLYGLGDPAGLGLATDAKTPDTPIALNDLFGNTTINDIHVGNGYAIAETSDGRYLAWGDNTYGQFGVVTSHNTTINKPVDVTSAWKDSRLQTNSSSSATIALNSNGSIVGAGKNVWYLLNANNKAGTFSPTNVSNRITQLNYSNIGAIRFGINKADYTVKDNNTIEVTVPAHAAGKVDVTITDNDDNKTVLKNSYEYADNTTTPEPKPEDKPNPSTKPETKPDEPTSPDYVTPDNNTDTDIEANGAATNPTITAPNTGI